MRYEIRGAQSSDEDAFVELAGYLNTVNLPNSRPHIRELLAQSEQSFRGDITDFRKRKYTFVLEDVEKGIAVGTSTIVAQLGQRDAPYIFLDVIDEEKYSRTLDKHFHHTLLRLGFSYSGPTELGGLVVRPEYRRFPERLGLLISYVRFLFIAAHRELFQEEILAELLPPLEADGTSHLWEAMGRHFTGLSYAEADLLSSKNKDFIRDLFPSEPIYTSLLSHAAQSVVGKVGEQTKGVESMLRRIGFKYAHRIDPFDGGPHFVANTSDITLLEEAQTQAVARILPDSECAEARTLPPKKRGSLHGDPSHHGPRHCLVGRQLAAPPFFKAILVDAELTSDLTLPESVAQHLELNVGDIVTLLPVR
ncbi:MAG: arginine N-succinyltransferase [Polyangiaceae bacterium]|nr:arginine N-succinyltransferase [Polyangiaceae bacterium]